MLETKQRKATRHNLHIQVSVELNQKIEKLSQTLNMSKAKFIRKLIMDKADMILCNAPEVLRKLDLIGAQLAEENRQMADLIKQVQQQDSKQRCPIQVISLRILQNYQKDDYLETSFREIIALLKKMA
jgi:predicted DNA-binding protein